MTDTSLHDQARDTAPMLRGREIAALREQWVVRIMTVEMVALVALQNVALRFGESFVQIGLLAHLLALGGLLWLRGLYVNRSRAYVYYATVTVAVIAHMFLLWGTFSLPSLLLFMLIYFSVVFEVRISQAAYRQILSRFQLIAIIVAALVGLDWAVQVVGIPMPNLLNILPEALRIGNYAYEQPISWGSRWIKPNAIFFPEVSGVSIFISIAVVIEITFFKRTWWLIAFMVTLLATLAGSGVLLLVLTAPFLLRHVRMRPAIIWTVLLLAVVLVAAQLGVLENFLRRSGELGHEGSSGWYRFVEPIRLMGESLSRELPELLFGAGAGNSPKGFNIIWNPLTKALYEYGIPFTLSLVILTVTMFFGRGVPLALSWAIFVNYHLLSGGFVVPTIVLLAWLYVGAYRLAPAQKGKLGSVQPP